MNKKIKRFFIEPNSSFFLFGPRGSGKSTWLREVFKPDLYIDLLRSDDFYELSENPGLIRNRVLAFSKKTKIVIDEIQRCPQLLNEVHALIEDFPLQYTFALTGSSARKLKKNEANLLAGRALTRQFFPLTLKELDQNFDLETLLSYGSLPKIITANTDFEKNDYLMSYTQTYLREEIQQEALVRNLTSYVKFLKHLSLMNGQVLNLSNLSRESGIKRSPLENYMSILQDTLLGTIIEPIHLKAKIKEVSNPKFYFFDTGIVNALSGNLGEKLDSDSGTLFETLLLNEIRAYINNSRKNIEIYYWGTPSVNEVDFILTKGKSTIGIEVKYSKKWKPEFAKGLNVLLEAKKISTGYVVYAGAHVEIHGKITLLPIKKFSQMLNDNEII